MKPLFLALALFCVGCASSTDTTTQSAAAPSDEAQDVASGDAEKSQVICRYETPTGSHRSVRVCRTYADQELENRNSREAIRRRQGQVGHGGTSGG